MVSTVLLDFFVLGSYTVQKMVIWKGFELLTLGTLGTKKDRVASINFEQMYIA